LAEFAVIARTPAEAIELCRTSEAAPGGQLVGAGLPVAGPKSRKGPVCVTGYGVVSRAGNPAGTSLPGQGSRGPVQDGDLDGTVAGGAMDNRQ